MELKRLRQIVTAVALALAFVHLVWPRIAVDAITITLLFIAIVPWLAPIFKSIEFPGGWKVEFRDLQKAAARADSAGLLATAMEAATQNEHLFQRVAEQDPNLLESAIKIISDHKGWTHGGESGAHSYIDNLSSKNNGYFIIDWERDALKNFFTTIRNPFSHGPGSAEMPQLSPQQTNLAIETCMSWIKSLVGRL